VASFSCDEIMDALFARNEHAPIAASVYLELISKGDYDVSFCPNIKRYQQSASDNLRAQKLTSSPDGM
jgi:hypothetical protein